MDPINPIAGNPEALNQSPKPVDAKSSSNITVISMAIFILMSLGVVVFLYYQNQQLKGMLASYQTPTTSPTPVATTDPTANWKTYTNVVGFSFKYPDTLNIDSVPSISNNAKENNNPKATWISISQADPNGPLEHDLLIVSESTIKPVFSSDSLGTINIDNKRAAKYSQSGNGLVQDVYVINLNQNLFMSISVSSDQNYKDLANQILSTFKFTSASPSAVPSMIPVSSGSAIPIKY